MSDIPNGVPSVLVAGDTWQWRQSVPRYPATDGWTLKYRLISAADELVLTAAQEGTGAGYLVDKGPADTLNAVPGTTRWYAWVEKTSPDDRHTVGEGLLELLPNPALVDVASHTTHAERMLALIEAELERRLDPAAQSGGGVRSYQIGDRAIQFATLTEDELETRRGYYVRLVERERRPERGLRTVQAVFTTPGLPPTGRFAP